MSNEAAKAHVQNVLAKQTKKMDKNLDSFLKRVDNAEKQIQGLLNGSLNPEDVLLDGKRTEAQIQADAEREAKDREIRYRRDRKRKLEHRSEEKKEWWRKATLAAETGMFGIQSAEKVLAMKRDKTWLHSVSGIASGVKDTLEENKDDVEWLEKGIQDAKEKQRLAETGLEQVEIDLGNGETEVFPKPKVVPYRDVDANDYSHWERWARVPDDPVSLVELRKKKEEIDAKRDKAFEEANPDFCNGVKEDIKKRNEKDAKKETRAEDLKAKGNRLFKRKSYESAMTAYMDAMQEKPHDVAILSNLAQTHMRLAGVPRGKGAIVIDSLKHVRQKLQSVREGTTVLDTSPNKATCAMHYLPKEHLEDALNFCDRALLIRPQNAKVTWKRAVVKLAILSLQVREGKNEGEEEVQETTSSTEAESLENECILQLKDALRDLLESCKHAKMEIENRKSSGEASKALDKTNLLEQVTHDTELLTKGIAEIENEGKVWARVKQRENASENDSTGSQTQILEEKQTSLSSFGSFDGKDKKNAFDAILALKEILSNPVTEDEKDDKQERQELLNSLHYLNSYFALERMFTTGESSNKDLLQGFVELGFKDLGEKKEREQAIILLGTSHVLEKLLDVCFNPEDGFIQQVLELVGQQKKTSVHHVFLASLQLFSHAAELESNAKVISEVGFSHFLDLFSLVLRKLKSKSRSLKGDFTDSITRDFMETINPLHNILDLFNTLASHTAFTNKILDDRMGIACILTAAEIHVFLSGRKPVKFPSPLMSFIWEIESQTIKLCSILSIGGRHCELRDRKSKNKKEAELDILYGSKSLLKHHLVEIMLAALTIYTEKTVQQSSASDVTLGAVPQKICETCYRMFCHLGERDSTRLRCWENFTTGKQRAKFMDAFIQLLLSDRNNLMVLKCTALAAYFNLTQVMKNAGVKTKTFHEALLTDLFCRKDVLEFFLSGISMNFSTGKQSLEHLYCKRLCDVLGRGVTNETVSNFIVKNKQALPVLVTTVTKCTHLGLLNTLIRSLAHVYRNNSAHGLTTPSSIFEPLTDPNLVSKMVTLFSECSSHGIKLRTLRDERAIVTNGSNIFIKMFSSIGEGKAAKLAKSLTEAGAIEILVKLITIEDTLTVRKNIGILISKIAKSDPSGNARKRLDKCGGMKIIVEVFRTVDL